MARLTFVSFVTLSALVMPSFVTAQSEPASATDAEQADQGAGALPRAALLNTGTVRSGAEAERDAALDAVVHAALDRMDAVQVAARPALDLQTIQLALDCVGETPSCLRAVTERLQVDVLIAPAIQRTDSEIVLSILYFDARSGTLRRVSRRQSGAALDSETLDAVPQMLQELLQADAEVEAPAPGAELPAPAEPPAVDVERDFGAALEPATGGAPIGALVLGGAGVLALGAGAGFGLAMLDTQDEYDALDVSSPLQADAARDKLDQGRTQALLASVLLGAGGTAIAASAIWLAIELTDGEPAGDTMLQRTALRPWIGPGHAGLSLRGAFGEAP